MSPRSIVTVVFALVLGLVGLTTLLGSWYTVDQGERTVILRNGALLRVDDPGLHFKAPWIDAAYDVEVRTRKVTMDKLHTYSRDIQPGVLKISLNYRVDPIKVWHLFSTVGREYSARVIEPQVYRHVKDTIGKFGAADIIGSRDRVADAIYNLMRDDLLEHGIIVEGVQLENIDFSDAYEKAIEQAMQAEAEVRKTLQQLARDKVEADRVKVSADAAAYKRRTEADADAFAIEAKGRAEAIAINSRGEALTKNQRLVELVAAEKWDGKMPQTMLPGSALPFVNIK
jgi:regulator of protease activity HflC (stomatin/prohibitin superfamily)